MEDRVVTASLSNPSIEATDVQNQQFLQQPKHHRSRSFSALSGSSLLGLFAYRPRLFSKKQRPKTGNASQCDSAGSSDHRLMVPSQIVVSELCVDRDGEEFEVTWTAFDATWPSGGSGGGGRRTRSTSNSPKSSPPLRNSLRVRSTSSATAGASAPPSLDESTAYSVALGVGSHRRDQLQEAFRRSGCTGRRNAVCVELDRRHSDSALSRFSEHAAIVDAMKQCF